MIYVCYHIASGLNYQTNLDLVLQALLDFGYKNIVVIDQFKRCNVFSDDLIYTSPSSVTIEPKSLVFVSFYQDIIPFLNLNEDKGQVKIINIWHGMPIRAINLLSPYEKNLQEIRMIAQNNSNIFHLVASDFYKSIFSISFNAIYRNIYTVGNIRNLDRKSYEFITGFRGTLALYAPTYDPDTNINRPDSLTQRMGFEGDDILLNELLRHSGVHLFFKTHGLEARLTMNLYSNIHEISEQHLNDKRLDLNNILEQFGVLISDCSSLLFDFLSIEKPVIVLKPSKKFMSENTFNIDESLLFHSCPRSLSELAFQIEETSQSRTNQVSKNLAGLTDATAILDSKNQLEIAIKLILAS